MTTLLSRGPLDLGRRLAGAAIGLAVLFTAHGACPIRHKNAPPPATPVSVAVVEQRDVAIWDEFSGRLEAIERVEVRSRVAGAVQAVHFREGALVKQGDLLITIDPAPYAAEVERAQAQVVGAEARVVLDQERARARPAAAAVGLRRDFAKRPRSAPQRLSRGRSQSARRRRRRCSPPASTSSYTEVRAPVSGRVGKLEITVGNLVAAGPGAPVLTTLVSVNPIYASFNADEQVVMRALKALAAEARRTRRSSASRCR